ncbi:hypothetical protein [Aquimarina sp. RZ0]|uniref:hypothetical protein n=1 Tax=Aquimarina sp. RZ0 TaxID=2607730 RepID=UPI0011F1569A|nr:hypothetical protein [Aquimarina sp. RZ0]KAA1243860.1 hypothetical protein F0000_18980 [Aquimarina sp. RZ0]
MTRIRIIVFLLCCIFYACSENESTIPQDTSLASLVSANTTKIDNVIACASSSGIDESTIIAYVYPRPGATDISYYETSGINLDKNEYQNYKRIAIPPSDFFNGYLKKFERTTDSEKWVIITFFEDGVLHLSNPIRLKHRTKPTTFTSDVSIDMTTAMMPVFGWTDGVDDDTVIYFQVISDMSNELLSGTYTTQQQFQYYKLDNVVLNITRETPPQLNITDTYNFTLMGVSEDNWVNLFIERSFMLTP